MDIKIQEVINELIGVMESAEADLRQAILDSDSVVTKEMKKDPFRTGLVKQIEYIRTCLSEDNGNRSYCSFEMETFSIPAINRVRTRKEGNVVDLTFVTKEIFDSEVVPALHAWAQNKVDTEVFGGLYEAELRIYFKLQTDTLPENKDERFETARFSVVDEKRLTHQKELLGEFIVKEKYEKAKLDDVWSYIRDMYHYITDEKFEEIGKSYLVPMSEEFMKKATKGSAGWSEKSAFTDALTETAKKLTDNEAGQIHTPEELSIAYQLCDLLVNDKKLNAEFKWDRAYELANKCMAAAIAQGYDTGEGILDSSEKMTPEEILEEGKKWVSWDVNHERNIVRFEIKEENANAYIAMLTFIDELFKKDFSREYRIEFDSKVKNFIPTELNHTDTNNFFANAAQYPEVHNTLKEYAKTAFKRYVSTYEYYTDAGGEASVPYGGYAAMALAFADPKENFVIAEELIANADLDHAISVHTFIKDFTKVCKGANKKKMESHLEYWD